MMYYLLKVIISAGLIVLISEVSKRSSFIGAIFASIPLVSFLAILWMYFETKDTGKIAELSIDIFWLVLPSLLFFILFPILLKRNWNFFLSFFLSTAVMVAGYFLMTWLMKSR
ncbi:MAG: DUF3147 family protein [Candidatus Cloacimonetes bacterium]|nr:DUF3147 family protein [Candidatus Syntrophosphaera sp.]NLA45866.1 DUF3147 family protein [Candidatus Cloacimonadota bacterium]